MTRCLAWCSASCSRESFPARRHAHRSTAASSASSAGIASSCSMRTKKMRMANFETRRTRPTLFSSATCPSSAQPSTMAYEMADEGEALRVSSSKFRYFRKRFVCRNSSATPERSIWILRSCRACSNRQGSTKSSATTKAVSSRGEYSRAPQVLGSCTKSPSSLPSSALKRVSTMYMPRYVLSKKWRLSVASISSTTMVRHITGHCDKARRKYSTMNVTAGTSSSLSAMISCL
mmetsp:Transcript_47342/g.151129  ORF Transcript_47342/g.151129 Transcript_47342/m.151129 type:complete len:233 (-) Transcript_47342:562-1260(-)